MVAWELREIEKKILEICTSASMKFMADNVEAIEGRAYGFHICVSRGTSHWETEQSWNEAAASPLAAHHTPARESHPFWGMTSS